MGPDGETKGPLGEQPDGPYPIVVDKNGKKRFLVQTPPYGRYLAKLELNIDGEGNLENVSGESNPQLLKDDQGFVLIRTTLNI